MVTQCPGLWCPIMSDTVYLAILASVSIRHQRWKHRSSRRENGARVILLPQPITPPHLVLLLLPIMFHHHLPLSVIPPHHLPLPNVHPHLLLPLPILLPVHHLLPRLIFISLHHHFLVPHTLLCHPHFPLQSQLHPLALHYPLPPHPKTQNVKLLLGNLVLNPWTRP